MMRLGVVMDPIGSINIKKDSTFAMLLEAQRRGWDIQYMEQRDLRLRDDAVHASMRGLRVADDPADWYQLEPAAIAPLATLDVILMRKDPPFDTEYVYTTHLLEIAEAAGAMVVNRPASLRDVNEKLYAAWFPRSIPPLVVTREAEELRAFLAREGDVVLKPLHAMGGQMIFRLRADDPNVGVAIETLTDHGRRFAMAQRYLPEIQEGDKRILLIDGEPVPYALARIPPAGESRGNLAVGGKGVGVALSARDRAICAEVGPVMREKGLLFVGLDVIGDYLTEINVTSPTCIRELDRLYGLNISAQLFNAIERRLPARRPSGAIPAASPGA